MTISVRVCICVSDESWNGGMVEGGSICPLFQGKQSKHSSYKFLYVEHDHAISRLSNNYEKTHTHTNNNLIYGEMICTFTPYESYHVTYASFDY